MINDKPYSYSLLMNRKDVAMERKLAGSMPLPPGHYISWEALIHFNVEQWLKQQEVDDGKRLHVF